MAESDVFQLLGLVFVAAGLGMLAAPEFYNRMVADVAHAPAIVFIGGVTRLAIGYLLVRYFTDWSWSWALVLTIFGWLALIIGVLMLIFPNQFVRLWRSSGNVSPFGAAAVVAGAVFLAIGFWG